MLSMGWREDARKEVKKIQAGGKYKLKEGENTFRILPNRNGLDHPPYLMIMQHGNVGPDERMVNCGKDTDGNGSCWLCDVVIPKLAKSSKKSLRDKAEKMRAKRQMIVQVATVDGGEWDGPFLWYVSTGGAKSLSTMLQAKLSSTRIYFDHPVKGRNLTITRTGTGMRDTRYGSPDADESRSIVPKVILKKLKRFEEIIPEYDPAVQQAMYKGEELPRRKSEDADEDEQPKRRRASGRKKPKPEPEEQEEFDFEDSEEPEAEEEVEVEEADGDDFDFEDSEEVEEEAEAEEAEEEEEADGDDFDFEDSEEAEEEAEADGDDIEADFDFGDETEEEGDEEAEAEAEADDGEDDLDDFTFEDEAEEEPKPKSKPKPATKKAPAKKAPVKKTATKKAPAKKAPAKKTTRKTTRKRASR